MSNELKPCPFCGMPMEMTKVGRDWHRIEAEPWHKDECPIDGQEFDYSQSITAEEVADIWNTRHSIDHEQEQRDNLERHNKKVREIESASMDCYQAGYEGLAITMNATDDMRTAYANGAKDRQREREA